jgi:hypothetical protein
MRQVRFLCFRRSEFTGAALSNKNISGFALQRGERAVVTSKVDALGLQRQRAAVVNGPVPHLEKKTKAAFQLRNEVVLRGCWQVLC